jgi:hypothetical protein
MFAARKTICLFYSILMGEREVTVVVARHTCCDWRCSVDGRQRPLEALARRSAAQTSVPPDGRSTRSIVEPSAGLITVEYEQCCMPTLYVCQSCGEAFEPEADSFYAICSACGHRHQPAAGCC